MMLVRTHAISSLTKSVDRMETLISIFVFSKKQDVFLIHHFKKSVTVRAALILKAVQLTSPWKRPIINIKMTVFSGIINVDI